ncbi:rRNA pseudouridine synthase [candidate division KSB1 bacterium]|nr:rRNA pseudouridine synthase [candidate division KSB1 bacterium]
MPSVPDNPTPSSSGQRMHLVRVFSKAGLATRREAKTLILSGRVKVNGQVVKHILHWVDLDQDQILFDDQPVLKLEQKTYVLFHKPRGYLTTVVDAKNRPTIFDLLPQFKERIVPVGRLDQDSEGLLLLTNDGPLGEWLINPDSQISKTYRVLINKPLQESARERLQQGLRIGPILTRPAIVQNLPGADHWIQIVICEGKKRQIRRMLQKVGCRVRRLIRTDLGPLKLQGIPPGGWRELTIAEIEELHRLRQAGGGVTEPNEDC